LRTIVACKLYELTTDLVCCDIVTSTANGEQMRTIHKELLGFDAAMNAFQTLPSFTRQWRDAVVLPPFATNRTVIYDRAKCA
jgi:hypothetical protein